MEQAELFGLKRRSTTSGRLSSIGDPAAANNGGGRDNIYWPGSRFLEIAALMFPKGQKVKGAGVTCIYRGSTVA